MPTTIDSPYGPIDVDDGAAVGPHLVADCAIMACFRPDVSTYRLDLFTRIQLCREHAWVLRLDVPKRVQPDTI